MRQIAMEIENQMKICCRGGFKYVTPLCGSVKSYVTLRIENCVGKYVIKL
jgi:hypothetical protein